MHQTTILLCIAVCCSLTPFTNSVIQYKAQKVRGPPVPSRITRNPQHLATYTHQHQHHNQYHNQHPNQHPIQHPNQHQHYTKSKWPIPQRTSTRPSHVRPIPVHMASYKVPVIARPPKTPAPLIFPSAVWKTPTAIYRPPVENNKPYLVSPPVIQQFDYHINKEHMLNIPTIKQIGEKGPIHTIPAPRLGPADKPKVIYEEQAKQSYHHYPKEAEISANAISHTISNSIGPATLIGAQALPLVSSLPSPHIPHFSIPQQSIPFSQSQFSNQFHQYQVTENAEGADTLAPQVQFPLNGQKTYYAPDPDTNFIQKFTQYTDSNSIPNNLKLYSQDMFVSPHQFVSSNAANMPLSAQDLYQLLNGVPQQQLADSYGMPLQQQSQLQQHFIQQASQNSPAQNYQYLQPHVNFDSSAYFNQVPETVSQQFKENFKPQFQTFNYEEPKKDFAQSRVTADYSIEPDATDSSPKAVQQNPHEALAQTQYIQQYFATRDDKNAADNELESNNEHEGSTRASQILSQLSAKNEISPTMFYSSLPNKEAAEALATLQAAGSINSVLKVNQKNNDDSTNSNQRNSMRIYVPDDEENYDDLNTEASGESNGKQKQENQGIKVYETTHLKQQNAENRSDESTEYEDYSGEENATSEVHEQETNFGNKLKSKTTMR